MPREHPLRQFLTTKDDRLKEMRIKSEKKGEEAVGVGMERRDQRVGEGGREGGRREREHKRNSGKKKSEKELLHVRIRAGDECRDT